MCRRIALDTPYALWLAVPMINETHYHVTTTPYLSADDFVTFDMDVAIDYSRDHNPFVTPCEESTCAPRD